MTQKAPEKPPVVFVDDAHAPEFFASEAVGFGVLAGVIHITFASTRINHESSPGPINRVVNLRLVMPTPGAQGLVAGLYDFLKNHGLDPVPKPETSKMQ
jgi:hypothetical protein